MNNNFYVYCHVKKTDGLCFYIGKGIRDRYKSVHGRNQYWHNVVNKHGFESIILINNISEEDAFKLEYRLCKQLGYENLCNIREENGWGGYSMAENTKSKLSKALRGRILTDEHKEKISRANKGKKRTEETKRKISESKKGHECYNNPERNVKILNSTKGQKRSEETKQKMKKPKPKGFGDQFKDRDVTWGDKISENRKGKGCKVVTQFDKNGNLINEFPSTKHAADFIGVHQVNMINHLNGKYKTCKGFIFKYKQP